MNLVDLGDARRWMRLQGMDDDYPDIEVLYLVNIASNVALANLEDDDKTFMSLSPIVIPYQFQAAALLMIGELFMNREASTADLLTPAVRSLLAKTPGMA